MPSNQIQLHYIIVGVAENWIQLLGDANHSCVPTDSNNIIIYY